MESKDVDIKHKEPEVSNGLVANGVSDTKKSTKCIHILRTSLFIGSFIAMGLTTSLVYSTVPDFRQRLGCTAEDLYAALSLGQLGTIAAIPFSILSDKYSRYSDVFVGLSLFVAAASNVARPYGKTTTDFTLCEFFDEISWATIESVATTAIPKMWKEDGQSAMLAMFLGYPIGASIGAQIASLVVSREITSTDVEPNFNHSTSFLNVSCNETLNSLNSSNGHPTSVEESHMEIGFIIAGVYLSVVGFALLVLQCCRGKYQDDQQPETVSNWKDIFTPSKWSDNGPVFGVKIFIFFVLFEICLISCFASMGSFITVFAVDSKLNFSPSEAARLNAIATLMDALSTFFCAVCFTRFLSVKVMLMIEVHGLLLSSVGALVLGTRYKIALYVFTSLFQMFKGPAYSTIFSWVDHYITPLCTLLSIVRFIRLGAFMAFLRFLGYLYDNVNIESIFYTTVGITVAMCLLIYIIYKVTYGKPYRYSVMKNLEHKDVVIPLENRGGDETVNL